MSDNDKPDLIILEGPDKAGKSTVYQAFRKATNYQPLIIDRFIGSNIVYDQLYNREDHGEDHFKTEQELMEVFDPLIVYLYAPISLLLTRSIAAGDIESEKFDIENISHYYNDYLNHTSLHVISIDTSKATVKETVTIIKWALDDRTAKRGE